MVKEIGLSRGLSALVDDADYELLSDRKWHAVPSRNGRVFYAVRSFWIKGEKNKWGREAMHRIILPPEPGLYVDHINGNGLDNRRCNLRICTQAENQQNRRNGWGASSHKGVLRTTDKRMWQADIYVAGKPIRLGRFQTELEAAKAYNDAALALFGQFANLNKL